MTSSYDAGRPMQFGLSDIVAIFSAIFALAAFVVAMLAWLFPRKPRATKIPAFEGEINNETAQKFMGFLRNNKNSIVKIRAFIGMDSDDLIDESTDDEGYQYHGITLRNPEIDGLPSGGLELSVRPESGSRNSPVSFANGAYHINGFFVIEYYPGMWQGFIAASIKEVSVEHLALRN